MGFKNLINNTRSSFVLLQCLGWGTLFGINFYLMWLSGEGAWERSLNLLVFLTTGVICSFILRSLLKPVAQQLNLVKLASLALLYSFIMATVTVQLGFMLLAVLPESFGGKPEFQVNVFIMITIGWSILFAIWSLFYIFFIRQRDLKKSKANEAKLDALLTKARLNTLHSQINPHFMFNAINNIRALVLEDKNRSRDMLANLSDILRYSLESKQTSLVSIEQELEIVDEYLELCKIQFEGRLNISKAITPESLNLNIPRMLIQMLVENAIKHGISECIDPGKLSINISTHESTLKICISNTGTLKENSRADNTGIGLQNIRERLSLIYNEHAKFVIQQLDDQVQAVVTVNMIEQT